MFLLERTLCSDACNYGLKDIHLSVLLLSSTRMNANTSRVCCEFCQNPLNRPSSSFILMQKRWLGRFLPSKSQSSISECTGSEDESLLDGNVLFVVFRIEHQCTAYCILFTVYYTLPTCFTFVCTTVCSTHAHCKNWVFLSCLIVLT